MSTQEKFCLRWNDFESNISLAFRELREDKDFFDVTLACEDDQIQAHKVILSACSPFFRTVLKRNPHERPLLYLKGVRYLDIAAVLNFMYHGEVNIAQENLNTFLAVAEDLQVKGLTQNNSENLPNNPKVPTVNTERTQNIPSPKRLKPSAPIQAKPTLLTEDDIEEVVPIKSEPMSSQGNDNHQQLQPEASFSSGGRGEMVAETGDYENDYEDYGYEPEAVYNDNSMMSHNMSANSDGVDRAMNWRIEDGLPWGLNRGSKPNSENFIPCPMCGKTFKTRGSLATHKYNFHKEGKDNMQTQMQPMIADPMQLLDLQMEPLSQVKDIECPTCGKHFSTRGSLATHKYNYHRDSNSSVVRAGDFSTESIGKPSS